MDFPKLKKFVQAPTRTLRMIFRTQRIRKTMAVLFFSTLFILSLSTYLDFRSSQNLREIAKNQFNNQIANFVNAILREYSRNPKIVYPKMNPEKFAFQYSFPLDLIKYILGGRDGSFGPSKTFEPVRHRVYVNLTFNQAL